MKQHYNCIHSSVHLLSMIISGVLVCGVNVTLLAEWISPSKIVCRTTNCKGPGDVIVSTKSGGIGTSTVKFRGLQFLPSKSESGEDEKSFS